MTQHSGGVAGFLGIFGQFGLAKTLQRCNKSAGILRQS
jgi:hypothetical protein